MAQQQIAKDERSLGDLFAELASETGTLVRHEVSLAQAEVTQKAAEAGRGVGFLAVGGAVAYVAVLSFTAAVILLLAMFVPAWLAALLVGIVFAVGSYFLISSALAKLRGLNSGASDTIKSIKEDAKWFRKEVM